jgi:hypothetical protein
VQELTQDKERLARLKLDNEEDEKRKLLEK